VILRETVNQQQQLSISVTSGSNAMPLGIAAVIQGRRFLPGRFQKTDFEKPKVYLLTA